MVRADLHRREAGYIGQDSSLMSHVLLQKVGHNIQAYGGVQN